ncbi:IS66 family insertion sequence element accessory protein TnpA [Bradyrhizobium roseum]|uniref:IS66 family insertion sequence element accessory protein TnpA n=1 Tax=Bradyrhizobium roseum TaxID=3056648 RepID=UPI00387EA418
MGRKQHENTARRTWWSVPIEAWRRSGLSRRSYCRQRGLDQGTFARWLSVLVDA